MFSFGKTPEKKAEAMREAVRVRQRFLAAPALSLPTDAAAAVTCGCGSVAE
jgi:hypothetical protein